MVGNRSKAKPHNVRLDMTQTEAILLVKVLKQHVAAPPEQSLLQVMTEQLREITYD